jgi:hypothetical protein
MPLREKNAFGKVIEFLPDHSRGHLNEYTGPFNGLLAHLTRTDA